MPIPGLAPPPDVAGPLPAPALPPPVVPPGPDFGPPASLAAPVAAPLPAVAPAVPVGPAPIAPSLDDAGGLQVLQDASVRGQQAEADKAAAAAKNAEDAAAEQQRAAEQHAADAEELRLKQEANARAMDEAHRQTTAALDAAHAKTIPDFWAGREGKRAEMAFYQALGAGAQGLLGLGKNQASEIINETVDSYYRREKDKVDNLYKFAAMKADDEQGLQARHTHELAGLMAKYGATKLAIAARIDKQAALGQGRLDGAAASAMSAKLVAEGQEAIIKAKAMYAEINLRNAEAQRALAKAKGGSAGGGAATAAEAQVMKAIEGGASGSDVRTLAAKLGVKGQRVDALENQGRAANKAGGNGAVDPKMIVRDVNGAAVGVASTARAVPQANKDVRSYSRAIDQLKAAREYVANSKLPLKTDSRFHNAVLSVASTTNANPSDATTKHEEGTLTNFLGRPDVDAIDRKIDELTSTLAGIKAQLDPLPDGYTDVKTPAVGAPPAGGDMVTIKNTKGETKRVTREEAKRLGAI